MIINIFGGVLGIVLYTLIKARKPILDKTITTDWRVLISDNAPSWIWATMCLVVVSVIVEVDENAMNAVMGIFGLTMDFTSNFMGFLLMGTALSFGSKEIDKGVI